MHNQNHTATPQTSPNTTKAQAKPPKTVPFRKSWNLQESNEDRDFTPRVGAWHRDSYRNISAVHQSKRLI